MTTKQSEGMVQNSNLKSSKDYCLTSVDLEEHSTSRSSLLGGASNRNHSHSTSSHSSNCNCKNMAKSRSSWRKVAVTLEIVFRLLAMIFSRFWKLCTTGLLIVTLLFVTEGGSYAAMFFFFGIIGE